MSATDAATVAAVLAEHEIVEVSGGTATGSTWRCRCGESDITPGVRAHARALGRQHVAAALLAAPPIAQALAAVEAVARVEALADEWEHRYDAGDHMLGCPDGAGYYDLLTADLRAALTGGDER